MMAIWHWFAAGTALKKPAGAIEAPSVGEQSHQQRKCELGRGPFEARSWQRLCRHALRSIAGRPPSAEAELIGLIQKRVPKRFA